jgi:hypothetical protein
VTGDAISNGWPLPSIGRSKEERWLQKKNSASLSARDTMNVIAKSGAKPSVTSE